MKNDYADFKSYLLDLADDIKLNPNSEITIPEMEFSSVDDLSNLDSIRIIADQLNTRNQELISIHASMNSSKKLESLGTMAAGMAHEFNNVMQPIAGFSDIMLNSPGLPDKHYEWLNIILKSANRGADLVEQIMNFSRKDMDSKKEIVLFSDLINELFEMISLSKALNVDLELDNFVNNDGKVYVNKTEFHQVMINLFNNAVHAVSETNPGIIKIITHMATQTMKTGELEDVFVIEVSDNGYGMSEETMGKIFNPFFTTKPVGEGTGLGLSIIHNIMKSNHGDISVESKLGEGTSFKITLKNYTKE
jgi:signal transduction histidine kinase